MKRLTTLTLITALGAGLVGLIVFAGAASANHPAGHPATVCHKPGTPAEKTMTLPQAAVAGHLGHGDSLGPCQPPPPPPGCASAASDLCIDGDGVVTPSDGGAGAFEVMVGDALASFPVTGPGPLSGIDAFDNDTSGNWTAGDDLHVEDPGAVDVNGVSICPNAIRNAIHDFGQDCRVLDLDNSLSTSVFPTFQFVTCDVEFQITFTSPCDPRVRYRDTNGNGVWNSGEDLVLDVNNNMIFD